MTNKPKLPTFDEKRDELDAYIERFERFTASQHWNREDWAVRLSPLLTGKALQVCTRMHSENAHDYDRLKVALLKRYELTEEGYHQRFREIKPDEGETVFQFMSRLRRCFTQWTLMRANGLAISCTVGRPHDPVHLGDVPLSDPSLRVGTLYPAWLPCRAQCVHRSRE